MDSDVRVTWDGDKAKAAIGRGMERGVRESADHVEAASLRVVPRMTNRLANSSRVSSEGLSAAVSYDTPYAVRRHESRKQQRRGTWKYLERPLIAERGQVARIIADAVNRETAR